MNVACLPRLDGGMRPGQGPVDALLEGPSMTEEQRQQLWLHQAMLTHLLTGPEDVMRLARENIRRWRSMHPGGWPNGRVPPSVGQHPHPGTGADCQHDPQHQPPGARTAPELPVRRRSERDRTDPGAPDLPCKARAGGLNRQQLARLLRAACDVTEDPKILVTGSQAVLGKRGEDE